MFDLQIKECREYDVAVLGGGIAGASAAVSAARAGARVILIERGGSLGGTLTEGFIHIFCRDYRVPQLKTLHFLLIFLS